MGNELDGRLTERVKESIDAHDPAVTLDDLLNSVDADPKDIIKVVEELQLRGEVNDDIVFWRGGGHSSVSS